MPELTSKAKRVAGTFLIMLGAGLIVDLGPRWSAAAVLLFGAGWLAWGLLGSERDAALRLDSGVERTGTESSP